MEHFPWSALGRRQQAKVLLSDREPGGVWLSFWTDGGVLYFKDRQLRASYTAANGLGKGHVPGLRLDRDGALWAATEEGGLSRIKDGRIATLTTKNGLPCDTFTGRSRMTIVRSGCTRPAAWCASRAPNWMRGSPTRSVGLKRRFGMRPTASGSARVSPAYLRSSRREVHRWQTVVLDGRRRPSRRSPSSCCQPTPATGAHRANQCRPQNRIGRT